MKKGLTEVILMIWLLFTIWCWKEVSVLRERLELHQVLLTGPSSCTVVQTGLNPSVNETIFIISCKNEAEN